MRLAQNRQKNPPGHSAQNRQKNPPVRLRNICQNKEGVCHFLL
jgi:hypothetical protein